MEVGGRLLDVRHPDVRRQARVEAARQTSDRMAAGHLRAGDLAERMDAGIGPPRAVHRHRRPFEPRQRVFEQALDRDAVRLPLPADEPRPVVATSASGARHRD